MGDMSNVLAELWQSHPSETAKLPAAVTPKATEQGAAWPSSPHRRWSLLVPVLPGTTAPAQTAHVQRPFGRSLRYSSRFDGSSEARRTLRGWGQKC